MHLVNKSRERITNHINGILRREDVILERDEMTPMRREGTLIMFISLAVVLIGLVDLFFNRNYSSLTMILFSGAGFTGGFLWMKGKDLRAVPISYVVTGAFIALGFAWQGIFTNNWFWILVGAAFLVLSGMIARRYKIKTGKKTEGGNVEK